MDLSLVIAAWFAAGAVGNVCEMSERAAVQVVLDLDARTPGFQHTINVAEGTSIVENIAVYVFDPAHESCLWGIGYVGAINRGISLGHMPSNTNQGALVAMTATAGTPVNPGNVAWMDPAPAIDPGFVGPEVQYIEGGADKATAIPAAPTEPIFTVDITLAGAEAGDVFDLYLLDFVTVWLQYFLQEDYGAFSTQGLSTLDTGGDAVPDGTQSIYGVDFDTPVPVPPAAFLVDYVDGPPGGGPATICVVPLGDLDGDGTVGVIDFFLLLAAWGPCPDPCPPHCVADLNTDCTVDTTDFFLLLENWS
jgi:hypothetical protein